MWAEGVRLIEAQLKDASAFDTKTGTLFVLTNAVLVFVVGQKQTIGDLADLLVLGLLVVLVLLVVTFRMRRFATAPSLPALIPWANEPASQIRVRFMANLEEAYIANQRSLARKAFFFAASIYVLLGLALIGGLLFVLGT